MSRLHFLGTGAADWSKDNIDRPDYRGLSSILLDDCILIDLTGAYDYVDRKGEKDLLSKVDTVIITHSHGDHYSKKALERLCLEKKEQKITLYGDVVLAKLLPECENLSFVPIDSKFQPSFSCHGYEIHALRANHCTAYPEEQANHYFIEKDGKSLFVGFDGAWLLADTWDFLRRNPVDIYLIDATVGERDLYDFRNFSHNNEQMRDFMRDTMLAHGVLKADSKVILTHLARTLHSEHSVIAARAKAKGYIAAFDGMIVEY